MEGITGIAVKPLVTDQFIAAAAILTVWVTGIAAYFALRQLKELEKQGQDRIQSEKKWETIRACHRYSLDPVLNQHEQTIFSVMNGPVEQRSSHLQKHRRAVRSMLNYFDMIAIGVESREYVAEIVEKHLAGVMRAYVDDFIYKEPIGRADRYFSLIAFVRGSK